MSEYSPLQDKMTALEVGATASAWFIVGNSTIHTADAYAGIDIPFADYVPLADHSTSMLGGYMTGLVVDGLMERAANSAEDRGNLHSARTLRKLGSIAAATCALAANVAIETSPYMGYGDTRDIIFGAAASVPGIIQSKFFARRERQSRGRKRLVESL